MTTYACPQGHASETDDYCDTCGALISRGAASAGSAPAGSAPATVPGSAAGPECPNCGAPRAGAGRFCEDCGFDHETGKVPVLAAPTVPVTTGWTATIAVDREYFEDNAIEGVEFPADTPSSVVDLPPPQVRIGRKSRSKGTDPEIDLSDTDPGVSHSHALLTLGVDGVWLLSDLGSTNGTYLNDEPKPLTAGQSRSLAAGDRVHVGAWTTITLHAPGS